ncbi:biotin synthase BioB [bacterium]
MNKEKIKKFLSLPTSDIIYLANKIKKENIPNNKTELCSIINARSGACSEDCKFCAQSCHYNTNIPVYPMIDKKEMLEQAKIAKNNGAKRFGIVTSGNSLSKNEIKYIAEIINEITQKIGINVCASLGKLDIETLKLFKSAGLTRYHHNIETSEKYYSQIVSTHTFSDRLETLKNGKQAEIEMCSGGIIGIGETWDHRIDMALTLKNLDIDAIPLNVFIPIKGTPLYKTNPISCIDFIKTIALFRFVMPNKTIKLAAGREHIMKDFQALAFMAGANGMIIGGYLTIKGRSVEDDQKLFKEAQYL